MFDLSDYLYLAAGLSFYSPVLNLRQYKKNPIKYKNGRSAAILLFIAGVLSLSSVALAYFYGV